jgi:hypothetical protein
MTFFVFDARKAPSPFRGLTPAFGLEKVHWTFSLASRKAPLTPLPEGEREM